MAAGQAAQVDATGEPVGRFFFGLLSALFIALHLGGVGSGLVNPVLLVILLVAGFWLAARMAAPFAAWPLPVYLHLCVLFLACVLLSAFNRQPGEVLEGLVTFLPKMLVSMALADLLRDWPRTVCAARILLVTTALVALCGVAQSLAWLWFDLEYSLADEFFRYSFLPDLTLLRATAFARTANQFVPPVLAAALICVAWASALPKGRERRWLWALAAVDGAAIVLSMVRGAWLALALALALLPLVRVPRRALRWAGPLLALAAFAWAGGLVHEVANSLVELGQGGVNERTELLAAGVAAMLGSFNGVGINNFSPRSPTFEAYPVHNLFIQIGSELGVPGLLAFLFLLAWVGVRLLRAARHAPTTDARLLTSALAGGLFAVLILCLSEPLAYSQFVWIYLAVCEAGARNAFAPAAAPGPADRRPPATPRPGPVGARAVRPNVAGVTSVSRVLPVESADASANPA